MDKRRSRSDVLRELENMTIPSDNTRVVSPYKTRAQVELQKRREIDTQAEIRKFREAKRQQDEQEWREQQKQEEAEARERVAK